MVRGLVAAALLSALAGCVQREIPIRLELVTEACAGTPPLDGVTHLRFIVRGDELDPPIDRLSLVSEHAAELSSIPAGRNRVIEVRGYSRDPQSGGQVLALGRTAPFDLPDVVPLPGEGIRSLRIFLRRVDALVPTNLSVAPSTCTKLAAKRAAHSANVLPDGKVLLAGGFDLDASGIPVATATTELYDPSTGVFSDGPTLGVTNAADQFTPSPRAFHSGTSLPNGQVLISGGELYDSAGAITRLTNALVYDSTRASHAYGAFNLRNPRSRHGAGVDPQGRVLIVGGYGNGGAFVSEMEWWSGEEAGTQLADQTLSRVGMSISALPDGSIAIAGGQIGSGVTNLVQFFTFDGRTFTTARLPTLMTEGRRGAPVVPFGSGGQVIVVGGFATLDDDQIEPLATTEIIDAAVELPVVSGPTVTARGLACAIGLPDGRVFTAGGRGLDEFFAPQGSPAVEVITPLSTGGAAVLGMPPLPTGRYLHTCTLLADGTILITGGESEFINAYGILDDAYVFTPSPRE